MATQATGQGKKPRFVWNGKITVETGRPGQSPQVEVFEDFSTRASTMQEAQRNFRFRFKSRYGYFPPVTGDRKSTVEAWRASA